VQLSQLFPFTIENIVTELLTNKIENMITSKRSLRDLCLIKDLHPGKSEWTIHCRVTCKRPIRTFGSQRGEGEIMSVDLADTSGEIRGVAFNEVAHRIHHLLKMNKVYIISDFSGSLLSARKDCTTLDHKYEIHFGEITYIAKK
jgi:replication factor A1